MDKKIRNLILGYLYKEGRSITTNEVFSYCYSEYKVPEKDFAQMGKIRQKGDHVINVLTGEKLIDNEGGENSHFIWLTAEGYKKFDPWYKKAWNFINNDFAKLLSLIAVILSIIATVVSLSK